MTSLDFRRPNAAATNDVVNLARALVRCDTTNPPGRELLAARIVSEFLSAHGVEVAVRPFDGHRANLIARLRGVGGPGLMFSGHLDTVPAGDQPWAWPAHSASLVDGHLHGRGTVDMKGAIAAMAAVVAMCARTREAPRGDLILALTAGEEVDSCGAKRLVADGALKSIGSIVIGEPTGLRIGAGHKGALWVNVEIAGLAAHGSRPEEGINSIQLMLDWLSPRSSLEQLVAAPEHPLFGVPTLSINMLAGGVASNIVPEHCRALLDYRTLPTQSHDAIVHALMERSPAARVSVQRRSLPVVAEPDSVLVRVAQDAAAAATGAAAPLTAMPYLTDGSVFTAATDATIILVGPGDERLAHAADERIPVQALHQAADCYERIARALLYE